MRQLRKIANWTHEISCHCTWTVFASSCPERRDKVFKCITGWEAVLTELNQLVSSSTLGAQLYTFAGAKTLSQQVTKKITEGCAKLAGQKISNANVDIMHDIGCILNIDLLEPNSTVDVTYLHKSFPRKVRSIAHEVNIDTSAEWKGKAFADGSLPKFWASKLLVGDRAPTGKQFVVEESCATGAPHAHIVWQPLHGARGDNGRRHVRDVWGPRSTRRGTRMTS